MPHLTLEYSSNIIEKNDMKHLFKECHVVLTEMLPTDLNGCKSKAIEYEHYYIGDGNINNAFIHANLKVMPGRSPQTFEKLTQAIMVLLKNHFKKSFLELQLQITIEVNEFPFYLKITS
jgi:5-carboxymethyl-2-hydroxymuconate isomerase